MKILSLELFGYKRFLLTNTEYFKITTTEQLQLILGTNGSGKSSLLRELSPLPAQSSDYKKEGYKIINIEHNKVIYTLKSSFSPSQKHSFIKNGIELNPSGTGQVQKELVKQEFNITFEIQELLINDTVLTEMGPAERRKWFTALSDVNYDYAISVYQKVKEKQRDVSGALKMAHSRLANESLKLLNPEDEENLRNEILDFQNLLDYLLNLRPDSLKTLNEIKGEIKTHEGEIRKVVDSILHLKRSFTNYERFGSFDDIDNSIILYQVELKEAEIEIEYISREVEHLNEVLHMLDKTSLKSMADLDININSIDANIKHITSSLMLGIMFDNPSHSKNALNSIFDQLNDIFSTLPENKDGEYSRSNFNSLNTSIEELTNHLKVIHARQDNLVSQNNMFEHLKEHNKITCPECKHNWVRDYNPEKHQEIIHDIKITEEDIIKSTEALEAAKIKMAAMREYIVIYKSLADIIKAWPILQPFWDHLVNNDIINKDPKSINFILMKLRTDLDMLIEIKQLEEELVNLKNIKLVSETSKIKNKEETTREIEDMNGEYYVNYELCNRLHSGINRLVEYKSIATKIIELSSTLKALTRDRELKHIEAIKSVTRDGLNDLIREVQIVRSNKEQRLAETNIQRAIVNDITQQIAVLEVRNDNLKLIFQELSPTDGIIARGMLGFIDGFIKQMNSFIKKVWLYPLVIQSCKPELDNEVELDYKFKLVVNDSDPVSDIKMGSAAMKEIINLAFKLVAMKYLNITNSPLFLDEFGRTMDSAHRISAFKAVTDVLLNSDYSQIFMVSHYSESYGSLTNSEICVLCDANIVIPENTVFNKHVVIS